MRTRWPHLHHPPGDGLGFGGPQAEDVGVGFATARATTSEPRLKLSVILDPALDSELMRLPQAKVREMFTSYVKLEVWFSGFQHVVRLSSQELCQCCGDSGIKRHGLVAHDPHVRGPWSDAL